MKLRNTSHKQDAWILFHFHWVRKEMKVGREVVTELVTKTKTKSWSCWLGDLIYKAKWRGRWTQYLGYGNKIMVKVTDGGRDERIQWLRGFAHEIKHAVGGTEAECKAAEDWIQKRWEKQNG